MNERDAKAQLWREIPADLSPAALRAELALTRQAGQLFCTRYSCAHDIIKVIRPELERLQGRPKVERTVLAEKLKA